MVNQTVNTLAHKAVLANLTLRRWGVRKFDKLAAAEVLDNHKAQRERGSFSKRLLDHKAMEKIQTVWWKARSYHYRMTLPWLDDGARILPTALYLEYAKEMSSMKAAWQAGVTDFIKSYPAYRDQAKTELGQLYNEEDYPDIRGLANRFSFEVGIFEMPSGDFRADLDPDIIKDLKDEVGKQVESTYEAALKSAGERIVEVVGHMADKLAEYTPGDKKAGTKAANTFKDSLVQNVRDLAELLPAFNLTNDQNLSKLHKQIVDLLCKHEAADLREDDKLRKQVAKNAKDILAAVEDFMS